MEIAATYSALSPKSTKAVSRQELLTEEFFKVLLKNYTKERSVAFYAEKLCLTPKYLSMTVKSVTGHPISEWINEAVIIEAKRMLKVTDLTVLQISEELNFPNSSFFGRFFKQYTEMTPLQYKNS
jgi:AraC-like DNA-binding protein